MDASPQASDCGNYTPRIMITLPSSGVLGARTCTTGTDHKIKRDETTKNPPVVGCEGCFTSMPGKEPEGNRQSVEDSNSNAEAHYE